MPHSVADAPALPFVTPQIAAIPGAIKRHYEDFVVDEIPLYDPCGHGDHVYFRIEKCGLATLRAVSDIARALGVAPRAIGVAGLKDARGITRQTLSLEHADPQRIAALDIPRIRVLSVSRHTNKLRKGHLRGNRFVIRLRETSLDRLADVRAVLDTLTRRGTPNYFGPQRFGLRGDTGRIGAALLHDDFQTAVELIAGRPGPHDTDAVLMARELFADGRYAAAAAAWPYGFRECAHVCRVMARTGGKARRAILALDRRLLSFYVSAFQSELFNQVLARRIEALDQVQPGDLAWRHDNGAVFRVEDAAAEQPRAERFEISATGPLFGHRMTPASGAPGELEREVLRASGFELDDLPRSGALQCVGGRRPLRFRPADAGVDVGADEHGPYLELRFSLPAGCYATSILRELCKDQLAEGLAADGED